MILKRCDLTPSTVILQAVSLYIRFGEEFLPLLHRVVRSRVTSDVILKAAISAYQRRLDRLTSALSEVYNGKISSQSFLSRTRVCAVVDASGSIAPGYFRGSSGTLWFSCPP